MASSTASAVELKGSVWPKVRQKAEGGGTKLAGLYPLGTAQAGQEVNFKNIS